MSRDGLSGRRNFFVFLFIDDFPEIMYYLPDIMVCTIEGRRCKTNDIGGSEIGYYPLHSKCLTDSIGFFIPFNSHMPSPAMGFTRSPYGKEIRRF
jgi:hypothetical protein